MATMYKSLPWGGKNELGPSFVFFFPFTKQGEILIFDMWRLRGTWNIQVESQSKAHSSLN